MCLPCCFPFADVYLEDPPKKKKEKKEEEKKEFVFVNDDAVFVPTGAYHPHPQLAYPTYPPAVAYPTPAPTHNPWPGKTRAQIDAENLALAHRHSATKPAQLVPYDPRPDQQFWCRELDSSYTLRTGKEVTDECQPGYWQYAQGGYPFWVRAERK